MTPRMRNTIDDLGMAVAVTVIVTFIGVVATSAITELVASR